MAEKELPPATKRVVAAASEKGLAIDILAFDQSTRTAEDAAAAIGCEVAQIVKSLVFTVRDAPVMVLVSGANQLDTKKLALYCNTSRKNIGRANADMVRAATGYAIGGVPPFGHITWLDVYIDQDLTQHEVVWAAAGTPNTVFAITSDDLIKLSDGIVADVKVDPHR